jgi:hypothetical protein
MKPPSRMARSEAGRASRSASEWPRMAEPPESVLERLRQRTAEASQNIENSFLGDVLSDEARRYKKSLLAVSVVGYLVSTYHINLKEIPWLSIPAPENARGALHTLVLVALGYHLIAFAVHAWADIRRWMLVQSGSEWAGQANVLFVLNSQLHTLNHAISTAMESTHAGTVAEAVKVRDQSLAIAEEAIRRFSSLRGQVWRIHWLKRLVAWVWDFAVPICAALVAAYCVLAAPECLQYVSGECVVV